MRILVTNDDGIVVLKKKGTEVRRLEPGVVSPQLSARKQSDEIAMEDISGMNEATQGKSPSASASGVTIEKLQNQAIGRIRLKDRYLQHYSMRRLAIITASLIINNWSQEKRIRLKSDDDSIEEFVFDPMKMVDLAYDVLIAPGSMAGIDKEALNALYLRLLDAQHITYGEYLKVADFPKRELLLKSLEERGESEAELQELQGQLEELQAGLEECQQQNAVLKGLLNSGLIDNNEKQILEQAARDALLNLILSQQPGAAEGQPEQQGVI